MRANGDFDGQALVAEAAAWRLASLLLERPHGDWQRDVDALAREVIDPDIAAAARAVNGASEEAYQRLFGPGGAISPREVSYSGFEDPGQLMAALQAFYRAFSFSPEREEAIDHVAVEAGFTGYLFLKEAYARMEQDGEAAAVTRSARQRFIEAHLKRSARGALSRFDNGPEYLRASLHWLVERAGAAQ